MLIKPVCSEQQTPHMTRQSSHCQCLEPVHCSGRISAGGGEGVVRGRGIEEGVGEEKGETKGEGRERERERERERGGR